MNYWGGRWTNKIKPICSLFLNHRDSEFSDVIIVLYKIKGIFPVKNPKSLKFDNFRSKLAFKKI